MEYTKSYKGFILWILSYAALLLSICFLPTKDGGLLTRVLLNYTNLALLLLMYIILKTEFVYWFSGTSFEEARDAGSDRRHAFALKHFYCFLWPTLGYLTFSVLAQLLGIPFWIDLVLFCVVLMTAAFSTNRYKL